MFLNLHLCIALSQHARPAVIFNVLEASVIVGLQAKVKNLVMKTVGPLNKEDLATPRRAADTGRRRVARSKLD